MNQQPTEKTTRTARTTLRLRCLLPGLVALLLVTSGSWTFGVGRAEGQITFRAAESASDTTGNLTITKPTGTVEDDVMIASIGVRPDTTVISPPAGWTLVRRVDNANPNANSLAVYRKTAGNSEAANYTWTLTGPTGSAGGIQTFDGVDLTSPIDVENGQTTANALTHATPSVTTTVADTMLVTAHTFSSAATWTPPAGMTEAFDVTGGLQATEGNYVLQASAGASGVKTATASADADVGVAHILALAPDTEAARYVRSGGVTGTSFSLDIGSAGTDRVVMVFAGDESTGTNLTGATVDGKACNLVTRADNANGLGNHQELWYCDEDDLGASNGSVTVAITGGDASWGTHAHLYTGAGQTGPTDVGIDQTSASVTTVTVTGIDVPQNGLVVMGAGQGQGGLTVNAWTSPLVERQNGPDPTSADLIEASGIETTAQTNKSYVATFSATFNRGTGIVAVWPSNATIALSGTLADGAVEDEIITGGNTLTFTLSGDTWDPTVGADNAATTALIAGIDSAQAEGTGWDAVVKANLDYNDVVRTSDTVVTITLGPEATYNITATETISVTVPAAAVAGSAPIAASETCDITPFVIQQRSGTSGSATTGDLTITTPAGTTEDDVLIASIGVRPDTTLITPPAGWTLVRRVDNANPAANSLAVYRKAAGGSEPANYTWTMTGAANSVGGIQAFSGVDTASPIDIENGQTTASSVSHATPSVTTTVADAMLVTSHTFASGATWTPPAGITEAVDVQSLGAPTTVESRVAASTDDAEEDLSDGSMYLDSSDLELISEGGTAQEVGMRFQGMTVPQGATVTNAYIEFETDELDNGATSLTFHAEDADNPGTFTSAANNISGRTKTFASVAWNLVPAWGTKSEKQQTPNLAVIIQEVVNRGTWASGNAMVVIVTGSGERTAESYNGESANAPLLHVEYSDTADGQSLEAGYELQAAAGATSVKTATAASSADVGNTHILALTPKSFLGAALTGTLTGGVNEYDITTGGETLIITLTGDTWDATVGADNAATTALIADLDSAQAEATGWDAVVKANLDYNDVVRTSATVVTITLGAEATYDITATETVTATIPATALAGASPIVATPSLAITSLTPFDFRKPITIDRTKVGVTGTGASTLANYPLLFSVTDVDLKSTGNGGDVTSASGDDILFRAVDAATCGGTGPCTLDHEIESYDPATGELVAWVRVPSLNTNAAGSDTVLYIYYGNVAVTASIEDADGVWDANYKGVWHLEETVTDELTSGTHVDSTTPAENGAQNGNVTATGQVFKGQDQDGTDDYIQTTSNELKTADTFTISTWFKADATTLGKHLVWQGDVAGNGWAGGVDDCSANQDEMHLALGQVTDANSALDDRLSFYLGCTIDSGGDNLNLGTAFTDTTGFNHVAVTVSSLSTAPAAELFLNGVSVATDTGTVAATPRAAWDTDMRFGRPGAAQRYHNGIIDEVRISTVARNADWIKTVYNNTSAPGDIGAADFYTVGAEDVSPLTAVELITFNATGYDRAVLLEWRTGYEIDNLGFHVYRGQAGDRVRLTTALVAGSGLLGERGVAVTEELGYAWWDMEATQTTPGITYWLEDVDFDGTSAWHGPVTPVDGGRLIDVGPPAPGEGVHGADSRSLDGFGQEGGASRRLFFTGDASFAPPAPGDSTHDPRGTQWDLAGLSAVKIGVQRSGWYRVTRAQLIAGGLDPDVNPQTLALFVDGVEQTMIVTGEKDQRLDAADAVEFYGMGVDTAYTDTRVYWLVVGIGRGLRVAEARRQKGQPTLSHLTPTTRPGASPTATNRQPRTAPPVAAPPAPAPRRRPAAPVGNRTTAPATPPIAPTESTGSMLPTAPTPAATAAADVSLVSGAPVDGAAVNESSVAGPVANAPATAAAVPTAAPSVLPERPTLTTTSRPAPAASPIVTVPAPPSADPGAAPSDTSSAAPVHSAATVVVPDGFMLAAPPASPVEQPAPADRGARAVTQREGRANAEREVGARRQAQLASELDIELRLARAAGVSATKIRELTAAFDHEGEPAANARVIETLRKARLRALGYDVTMSTDEHARLQAIAARAASDALTDDDVGWLRDQVTDDPAYFDRLPRRGIVAPATSDGDRPADHFLPGLDLRRAEQLSTLVGPGSSAGSAVTTTLTTGSEQ